MAENERSRFPKQAVVTFHQRHGSAGVQFVKPKRELHGLDADVENFLNGDKEVTDRWIENKLTKINKFKKRISLYSDLLSNSDAMADRFTTIEQSIMGSRDIDLAANETSGPLPDTPDMQG